MPVTANAAPTVLPTVTYTVAVPVYCEEKSLEELTLRTLAVFAGMGYGDDFEILFVDDGSTDGSFQEIKRLAQAYPFIRYLRFRTNQGKSLALMAAFSHASGRYIITIDADLQDNPEDIPALVRTLDSGYDIVSGWRKRRNDGSIRYWGSKLFNYTVAKVAKLSIHDYNCGFKIYRRQAIERLQVFGQLHRYLPLMCHLQGFKVGETLVENSARKYGVSKYPPFRVGGFFDLLSILFTSNYRFSPLHFFGSIGLLFIVPSVLALSWLIGAHVLSLFGITEHLINRPLLLLSVGGLMIGIQIFLAGFVCDFILHHRLNQNIGQILAESIEEKHI